MLATVLTLWASPLALAQDQTSPPQGASRGENFSAKPPAALFASDCTGSGCHKGPQGLGKNAGIGGLAGFLREHYTNSRESAAALANYLSKIPSAPEPKEARTPRGGKPATAAAPASSRPGGWFQTPTASEGKPASSEARKPPAGQTPAGQNAAGHTPPARASRASVKPEDDPVAPAATSAVHHPVVEPTEPAAKPDESAAKPADAAATPPEFPAEPAAKPAMSPSKPNPTARAQRGRQPAATAAAPTPPPAPEAAPAAPPPPPPPPPAPKEYDIFD